MNKNIYKMHILFLIGGVVYASIETVWRFIRGSHPTHWSMFILGGICFILLGALNEHISWDMPLIIQILIGTAMILVLEFSFGCILNIWLKLGIWDYSHMPFNILGQVCLPFAGAWMGLALVGIVVDDYLRYWLFKEEKPHYHLF